MVKLLCIQGNIGVGKSTVLYHLKQMYENVPSVVFVHEPVDEWEEAGLLRAMYDGTIDAGLFEVVALTTILRRLCTAIRDNPSAELVVAERCHSSVLNVFAKANLAGVRMTAFQLAYQSIVTASDLLAMTESISHVYLHAPLHTLVDRIKTRDRGSESTIASSYLASLQHRHDEWLLRDSLTPCPDVFMVDATNAPMIVVDEVQQLVSKLLHE
jgi:deoxyadenosine/deoxycytidine kinase